MAPPARSAQDMPDDLERRKIVSKLYAHLRANVVAYCALFVALGGSSYAAIAVPRGSVGSPQLRNGSVTPAKLGSPISGFVQAWAYVSATGKLYASGGVSRVSHFSSSPNTYGVLLTDRDLRGCASTASVTADQVASAANAPGSAVTDLQSLKGSPAGAAVETFNAAGQAAPMPFLVQVLCRG